MRTIFLLIFSSFIILSSCDKQAGMLEGSWEFLKMTTPGGQEIAAADTARDLRSLKYEFYENDLYTWEAYRRVGGEDLLYVTKGRWDLSTEKDGEVEKLYLIMNERQLEGIQRRKLEVTKLEEDKLVWQNEFGNEYHFRRNNDPWYEN